MAGTPTSDQIKFGILRTRDLVELYYQGRMAVQVIDTHTFFTDADQNITLLAPDPRRIRYEIILANEGAAVGFINVGTQISVQSGDAPLYIVSPNSTLRIVRDWRSDLDGVVREVWANLAAGSVVPGVRATYLSPLPVDEQP